MFINNKRKEVLQIILCFLSFVFILLSFIYNVCFSSPYIRCIFDFTQQIYIFMFFVMFLLINQNKIKLVNNNKVFVYLNLIIFVNIFMGIFIFSDILNSHCNDLISYKIDIKETNFLFSFIFITKYIIGYILLPVLFVIFFVNYYFNNIISFKKIWIIFVFPLYYFIINYLIHFCNNGFSFSNYNFFISPELNNDSLQLFFVFLKIIIVYLFVGLLTIFMMNKKNVSNKIKFLLFFLLLVFIPFVFYNDYDFKHVYFSLFNAKQQGATLSVEAQYAADALSDVTKKTKSELKLNNEKILELGSGTGNVTKFLVDKYGEENIVTVEINKDACDKLHQRFKNITIINGDIGQIQKLLSDNKIQLQQIKGIVSTLPMSKLPSTTIDHLENVIQHIMQRSSPEEQVSYKEYRYNLLNVNNISKRLLVDRLIKTSGFHLNQQYIFTSHFLPIIINTCYYKQESNFSSVNNDTSSSVVPPLVSEFSNSFSDLSYVSSISELGSHSSSPTSDYYAEIDKNFGYNKDSENIKDDDATSENLIDVILDSKINLLNLSKDTMNIVKNNNSNNYLLNKIKKIIKKIMKK